MNPHSHLAAAIDISAHASPSLSLNSLPQSSPPSIHTPGRTRTTPVARSGSLSEQESADGTEVSQMYFDLQPVRWPILLP
jgi:hypothetical protein